MRKIYALAFAALVGSPLLATALTAWLQDGGAKGVRVIRSDANHPVEIEVRGLGEQDVTIEVEVLMPDGQKVKLPSSTTAASGGAECILQGPLLPEEYRHHVVVIKLNGSESGKSLGSTSTTIS